MFLHALLAQLVEHLHGKEGVDGSSPSEGFHKAPAFRLLWSSRRRDAASRSTLSGQLWGQVKAAVASAENDA
jgi:hypothetical protein